jgi:hypothetical protein
MAFDDGKNGIQFLPVEERSAQLAEEFAARGLQNIQVTSVVNMIAGSALGIRHAVRVLESRHGEEQAQLNSACKVENRAAFQKALILLENAQRMRYSKSEIICCAVSISGYLASMDWQQLVSLLIVAAAAVLLIGSRFRRRRFSFQRDTHCGCSSRHSEGSPNSIVFRARKGERPEVLVKMN